MSAVTLERRRLRSEAAARQRTALRLLKVRVRKARVARAKHMRDIRAACVREQKKITRAAERARAQLRARIAKARDKAERVCKACKVDARESDLEALDRALADVQSERETIRAMRVKARGLRDERGRAGGRRSQELRRESDHQVEVNIADPAHRALWDRVKSRIKATPRMSRTEAFFQYLHDHPESVYESQQGTEEQWLREAEAEEARLQDEWLTAGEVAKLDDRQLAKLSRRLDRAEQYAVGDDW